MSVAFPALPRRILRSSVLWTVLGLVTWTWLPWLTSFASEAERTLYFKLPIEGARFHWRFLDTRAFLSGELTLRIINDGRDETHVVFRDGVIQQGWEVIDAPRPDGSIYFGFSSDTRVRTKASDSLIITLRTAEDLAGRGPDREGVLPAGVHQMAGSYSSMYGGRWNPLDLFVLAGDPPIAFMECWRGTWPIRITKKEGWHTAMDGDGVGLIRMLMRNRGTDGRRCGSHV